MIDAADLRVFVGDLRGQAERAHTERLAHGRDTKAAGIAVGKALGLASAADQLEARLREPEFDLDAYCAQFARTVP